jgi:uncharacterized glyoxalase superfamily protein PhnB
MPQCCPNIFYDDVAAAARFLCDAFGFEQRFMHPGPDGKTEHAQLAFGSAVVMLGGTENPRALRPVKSPKKAGVLTGAVYVFVEDVDAHCASARRAGAEVLLEPADMFWGDRIYCAIDPEGQFWTFATPFRDSPPAA